MYVGSDVVHTYHPCRFCWYPYLGCLSSLFLVTLRNTLLFHLVIAYRANDELNDVGLEIDEKNGEFLCSMRYLWLINYFYIVGIYLSLLIDLVPLKA